MRKLEEEIGIKKGFSWNGRPHHFGSRERTRKKEDRFSTRGGRCERRR